jgi:membrane-associated phospholipid phosphatase
MIDRSAIQSPLWKALVIILIASAFPFYSIGFRFDFRFYFATIQIPIATMILSYLLDGRGLAPRIARAAESVAQMSVIGLIGLMLAYSAATVALPLVDENLLRLDRAMSYDWKAFAQLASAHPWFTAALHVSYGTNIVQPVLIAVALCLAGQQKHYERYAIAMLFSGLFTAALFLLYPATTAWTYLGEEHIAKALHPYLPRSHNSWIYDLNILRDGGGRHLGGVAGIVAFPSHHCITAVLNIWACWTFKQARYPATILNGFMLISTLIYGGHYLTDVVAGVVVAVASIALGFVVERRFQALRRPKISGRLVLA